MLTSTVNTVEIQGSSATLYTFNQPIHKKEDLIVYVSGAVVPVSGDPNPHTITVAANKQSASIVFSSAPGDVPLKFERILSYKQETDLANNSLFDAESLETSLDNIVMQVQQIGNVVLSSTNATAFTFDAALGSGSTMFDDTPTKASTLSKTKAQRINKALAFDAQGDITVSTDDIDAQIAAVALSASNASSSAGAASTSAGTASSALASFQAVYRGASGDAPGSPLDGQLWFDSTNDIMKVYNGTSSAWEQLTPTSSEQTAINAVNLDAVDIGKVAALDTEVGRLGTSDMSVGADAYLKKLGADAFSNASNGYLKLVGDIDDKITNLGTTTVVAHITALNGTNVITHMAALNATNVITHIAALNASNVITNIGLVAAIDDKVTDVAAIDDKVTIVAGLGSSGAHVTTLAGLNTEIAALGASAVVTYMTALNASGVIANIAALNGTNVITHMAALNGSGVITNIAALNASGVISNIAALNASGVIGDIETVADMEGEVNNFALRYRVLDSEPGSANDAGDLYYNTTSNLLFSYGTSWQQTTPSVANQININIVAGELTYAEDLGSIAVAATTSSGNDINTVAGLDTEIGLLAAKATELGRLGTAEIGAASTGALARLGTAAVVEDVGNLGTEANVLAMAQIGTSTVVGHIAALNASGVVANIATVAGMVDEVDHFANAYVISDSTPQSPTPTEGDLWYDSVNNLLKFHNGTSFVSISAEIHNEMIQDTSPQLGGNLDATNKNVSNMGNIDGDNLNIDFGSIA